MRILALNLLVFFALLFNNNFENNVYTLRTLLDWKLEIYFSSWISDHLPGGSLTRVFAFQDPVSFPPNQMNCNGDLSGPF